MVDLDLMLSKLHQMLQNLITLHLDLLDRIQFESKALADADLALLNEANLSKEAVLHLIRMEDLPRNSIIRSLAISLELQNSNPTLSGIISTIQTTHVEISKALRSDLNTLVKLIERVQSQNKINAGVIEQSLKHIYKMKENLLGEIQPVKTYNPQGQTNISPVSQTGPRLISKEA